MKKIILVLSVLLLCACGYDEYKMPKDAYIKIKNKSVEIYDIKAKVGDLVGKTNTEILNKNELLKTTKIGKYKTTISYKYKGKTYKYDTEYEVKDTTKPKFLYNTSYKEILIGDTTDFCDDVVTIDNYDTNVKCSVEGNIDNSTVGDYNLKYILTDNSNNKYEEDLYVKIMEKYPEPEPSTGDDNTYEDNSLYFSDVIKKYKNKSNMIGIDVSAWQDEIDYEKVKKAGCEFVIIRIGINTVNDEKIYIDEFYKKNIKTAKKAGLKVGVYIYTNAVNNKKATEHAKWIIKTLNNEKLDFPVAFDFENWSDINKLKLNTYIITKSFLTFKDYLNKKGYDAMLYSSLNYLNEVWMYNDTYNVWLAHYTDETNYKGKYIMWQMANTGKIDGINGAVDIDIYYKE